MKANDPKCQDIQIYEFNSKQEFPDDIRIRTNTKVLVGRKLRGMEFPV